MWSSRCDYCDRFDRLIQLNSTCVRVSDQSAKISFGATLDGMNGVRPAIYEFATARLCSAASGSYSEHMLESCKYFGMKPICDHPQYCKNDAKALYIGQSKHLSRPSDRKEAALFPGGFASVKSNWKGLCGYTGLGNGDKASCNTPVDQHEWKLPSQVDVGFICGTRGKPIIASRCTSGLLPT